MGKRSKKKKVKKKLEKTQRKLASKPAQRQAPPTLYLDNYGNLVQPFELVFPIIRRTRDNKYEAVGTGFFIHPAGGFVTAKHCLYNGDVYDSECFAVDTIGDQHPLRKIQYFEVHPDGDIGVGMLQGQVKNPFTGQMILRASLPVSLTPPTVHDKISTLAYPRMKIDQNKVGTFPCDRYAGEIMEYLPDGTAWLKSACFLTNMDIKSGASGGPVMRGNHVIGINSSSLELPAGERPISFITPIHQIFDLTLMDSDGAETSIKELMDSGNMVWVP